LNPLELDVRWAFAERPTLLEAASGVARVRGVWKEGGCSAGVVLSRGGGLQVSVHGTFDFLQLMLATLPMREGVRSLLVVAVISVVLLSASAFL